MGLVVRIRRGSEDVEHPPSIDHEFRIGYWYSPYTFSGLDSVLRNTIGRGLWSLLSDYEYNTARDTTEVFPDWKAMLKRAEQLREDFLAWVKEYGSVVATAVVVEDANIPAGMHSWPRAVELFCKHKDDDPTLVEPKTVLTCIPGYDPYDRKVVYAIRPADGFYDWYVDALQVVVETIQWVLSQDDPSEYIMVWEY